MKKNIWVEMSDRKPVNNQEVYYYFEHIGVHRGRYERQELDECIFGEKGIMVDVFYGDEGWLCDDVTHWMPIENATVFPPDAPRLPSEVVRAEPK